VTAKYRLGNLDLAIISDGSFFMDAGAVFGLIPRILWEQHAGSIDERHRMALGLNCLLLRSQGRLVLIETGIGNKGAARRQATPASNGTLLSGLDSLGVRPDEIDVVINTHLHADHCGWNTRYSDGILAPTFPNAEYIVAREEWEAAIAPNERTRATYLEENLLPVEAAGRLRLFEGETRVTDEITLLPAPGHSAGHAVVALASAGETAVYAGDLAQTKVQFERTAWVSAFDILPLVSMETKKRIVEQAMEDGSLIVSTHAPFPGAGRMSRIEGGRRRWTAVAMESAPGGATDTSG
jgi:glyoxylase-like metal-dependent hydrolase (beta-lactamase superfamily II)